jgi:hypothetical protein
MVVMARKWRGRGRKKSRVRYKAGKKRGHKYMFITSSGALIELKRGKKGRGRRKKKGGWKRKGGGHSWSRFGRKRDRKRGKGKRRGNSSQFFPK